MPGNVNSARRVLFKPMLGLFNQDKLLPLRYCPIQIELELVNSLAGAVTTENWEGHPNGFNCAISDIQCKCGLLTLNNPLDNEYASHLLSGKSLPINFNTWNHTDQSTGDGKNFSAHITRAVTRLKSIFITPHKPDGLAYKQCKGFYHPASNGAQLSLVSNRSKLMPEYPVSSITESYMRPKNIRTIFQNAFKLVSFS